MAKITVETKGDTIEAVKEVAKPVDKIRKLSRYDAMGTREQIINHLKSGVPVTAAFKSTGISSPTFYAWMAKDPEFALDVRRAQAEAIARNAALINVAASTDWRAAAWYLERRSEDFKTKLEVTNKELPAPILGGVKKVKDETYGISSDNSSEKDRGDETADQDSAGGDISREVDSYSIDSDKPSSIGQGEKDN